MDHGIMKPLSWKEARCILREVMEAYLDSSPRKRRVETGVTNSKEKDSLLTKCIQKDLDLYVGAILAVVLLLLVSLSLSGRSPLLFSNERNGVSRLHLVLAVLIVIAVFFGLWLVQRYRFLCLNDSDHTMRQTIRVFLRNRPEDTDESTYSPSEDDVHLVGQSLPAHHTAQTEVFPVYRRHGSTASWDRLPSLLLVKGDWIALQIGDIAPASCRTEFVEPNGRTKTIQMTTGEKLSLGTFGLTHDEATLQLPRGKSTLTADATDSLLTLCNKMRVFILAETPLTSSLNRIDGLPKSSQVSHQLQETRQALFLLGVTVSIITGIVSYSRREALSGDAAVLAFLPIVSALAVLPIVGPTFVCLVEILGTARILTAAHQFSNLSNDVNKLSSSRLLVHYFFETCLSRFSVLHSCATFSCYQRNPGQIKLLRVPPASVHLLEKLGVATAFTLIDDELACEPQSIPQQLLIPSAKGLKLLDLCPAHGGEQIDGESDSETENLRRHRGKSFDSDSESDEGAGNTSSSLRRNILSRRLRRNRSTQSDRKEDESSLHEASRFDVQFEDPNWWQYIPTLKCIGLACLLLDDSVSVQPLANDGRSSHKADASDDPQEFDMKTANADLARLICTERRSKQLMSLGECIGFSVTESDVGRRGDISAFSESRRLHLISNLLFKERLLLDAHERSSEQSRWWGLLRPDATSIIVQDSRTKAFQLLTVGDPRLVCSLCNEAWQGEISTILPLATADRQTLLETTNNWKLADLDVAAFSYSPVPHTLEARLKTNPGKSLYLLDNADSTATLAKDKSSSNDWSFVGNQVFLGVLGSLVVPRKEIRKLLNELSDAGVRFVYFSPRNMRRQKELAIQMGIDVAWNCAISLRSLESGEDDPHRMVSNYADWDVNAKLPHGVRDVRIHLEEVDNVPLLVSLYTDATKATTKEMVEIFQEYKDTVISVGLSHLTRNEGIFACADIAFGIDILHDECESLPDALSRDHVHPVELEFVQLISSHSCAFRLRGASSVVHVTSIIEKGRAALDAAVTGTIFVLTACVSFSFYILFSICSPMPSIPSVPIIGSGVFILFLLPILGLAIAMSEGDDNVMKRVPSKNERGVEFARPERRTFYSLFLSKAILPALLPQILHPIVFGALVLELEPGILSATCPAAQTWVDVVRCDGSRDLSGVAKSVAGTIVFAQFVLCTLVASAGYVHRYISVVDHRPWVFNQLWLLLVCLVFGMGIIWIALISDEGTIAALPWYYFAIAVITPLLCLFWGERCKQSEAKLEKRAEKLRRLQFETRLGAWSPR